MYIKVPLLFIVVFVVPSLLHYVFIAIPFWFIEFLSKNSCFLTIHLQILVLYIRHDSLYN